MNFETSVGLALKTLSLSILMLIGDHMKKNYASAQSGLICLTLGIT
jgi:hypothetical protein